MQGFRFAESGNPVQECAMFSKKSFGIVGIAIAGAWLVIKAEHFQSAGLFAASPALLLLAAGVVLLYQGSRAG